MIFTYGVAIFLAISAFAFGAPMQDQDIVKIAPSREENYRLPKDIKPSAYEILLTPFLHESDDLKQFTFEGEVHIVITPKTTTNTLVLHSKELKYQLSEYWTESAPQIKMQLPSPQENNATDKLTFTLRTNLNAGTEYVLHFQYTGVLGKDMHGFYRSSYTNKNNITKWLGTTQFQTNHARRAFPSFDEPSFKATFDITIRHHKSMKAVSNSEVKHLSYENNDMIMTTFGRTPIMSTYLVAFIVSEFNERSDGTFKILASPEYYAQTEYSFEVGQKLLKVLDNYTNLPYYMNGIEKMHMAAIPDFSAGAMENWGLLTYRQDRLLYDPVSSTQSAKQAIAAVIAHEQAHMWFGDLVTCDWWSYAWLNEGFARYFQYMITAEVEKDWDMEKQFVPDQIHTVMGMDSTNDTNPLSDENTNSPADLSRMFNSITYNKGATVIRMVQHVLGEENFKKSLQKYLNENRFSTGVPMAMFNVWREVWPQKFKDDADPFFKSFTEQVGYPVIFINVTTDGKSFSINQVRFLIRDDDTKSNSSLLYHVPFTYTTSITPDFKKTDPQLFLPASTEKVTVRLPNKADWVIANIQQMGYYRVNYDKQNWQQIKHALEARNWSGIHELNRAQIVDDLLNLGRAGHVEYNLTLDVLEYLKTETAYEPWSSALNGYSYLAIRLGNDLQNFNLYIRDLTAKSYKSLSFEERTSDSVLDIYLRTKVLEWNGKHGNNDCIEKARSYFKSLRDSQTPVPVNIRSAVYCIAMREGSRSDYDTLFNKYVNEMVPTERTLLLNSMGCVRNPKLVEHHFHVIMNEIVRRQDKSAALSSLYSSHHENVDTVFKLVTDKYKELAESLGGYGSVASVISNIAARFTKESQRQDLIEFNKKSKADFGSSADTLERAEAAVDVNLKWSEQRLDTIKLYLNKRGKSSATTAFAFTTLTIALFAALSTWLC